MTVITNTVLTFDQKGIREDLSDTIFRISPEETPLVSRIGKDTTKQTSFDWQTDALGVVDTGNAHLEGDDIASYPTYVATARVGNYCQIMRKLVLVSGTAQTVDTAGRADEMDYQVVMRGAEMKRDLEAILFENIGGVAGATATPRKTATLGAWLKSSVDKAGDGANPVYTAGVPGAARTDGTQRAFTETIAKSVIEAVWTAGGKVEGMTFYLGPINKAKASAFAGVYAKTFNVNGPSMGAIVGAADVYVSEFGNVMLEPSRWSRERDGWLINHSFLSLKYLRPFTRIPLAKTGDADKEMLLQEVGLQVRQEAALGLAADLTIT